MCPTDGPYPKSVVSSDLPMAAFPLAKPWLTPDVEKLPSRTLAYIGDSVYELAMRMHHVQSSPDPAGKLHSSVVGIVNAAHQAQLFLELLPTVSEHEQGLLKHWRNAKLPSRPGSKSSRAEYARSTAFEAWIGYLFLTGQTERLQAQLVRARDPRPATPLTQTPNDPSTEVDPDETIS